MQFIIVFLLLFSCGQVKNSSEISGRSEESPKAAVEKASATLSLMGVNKKFVSDAEFEDAYKTLIDNMPWIVSHMPTEAVFNMVYLPLAKTHHTHGKHFLVELLKKKDGTFVTLIDELLTARLNPEQKSFLAFTLFDQLRLVNALKVEPQYLTYNLDAYRLKKIFSFVYKYHRSQPGFTQKVWADMRLPFGYVRYWKDAYKLLEAEAGRYLAYPEKIDPELLYTVYVLSNGQYFENREEFKHRSPPSHQMPLLFEGPFEDAWVLQRLIRMASKQYTDEELLESKIPALRLFYVLKAFVNQKQILNAPTAFSVLSLVADDNEFVRLVALDRLHPLKSGIENSAIFNRTSVHYLRSTIKKMRGQSSYVNLCSSLAQFLWFPKPALESLQAAQAFVSEAFHWIEQRKGNSHLFKEIRRHQITIRLFLGELGKKLRILNSAEKAVYLRDLQEVEGVQAILLRLEEDEGQTFQNLLQEKNIQNIESRFKEFEAFNKGFMREFEAMQRAQNRTRFHPKI